MAHAAVAFDHTVIAVQLHLFFDIGIGELGH
jgi:hypothetical protein